MTAATELGITLHEASAGFASFSSGVQIVNDLLALGASACIAFDDVLAQGICYGLAEKGIVVPVDYSVIGCDDILGFPLLTTVSSPSSIAGRTAVDMLVSSLSQELDSNARIILETDLVLRSTVSKPKIT